MSTANNPLLRSSWAGLAFSVDEVAFRPAWRHLKWWLLAAFALRAAVALAGDFVLHPDEIMQYLEPAHAAALGNGIINWEFYYGARNWLVPGFVAALLWFSDLVGLGEPWFYVNFVKLAFCLVSLLVPWGVYQFCRYRISEDVGRLALVLVCLWPFMIAYAHKPFTEFVATSILFAALGAAASPAARAPKLAALTGFLLALTAFVRMQYAPVALLAWLAFAITLPRRALLSLALGSLVAVVFVGVLETITWGAPFHSYYANLLFNLELNKTRVDEPEFFYLPRLVYMTAGGALISFFMMAKHPRRYLLLIAMAIIILALHMAQPHAEIRFIFLLLPLSLIPLADFLVAALGKYRKARSQLLIPAAATALFAVLTLGNYLPGNEWLYVNHSRKGGEVNFVRGQSNLWEIFRYLASAEDVTGVLHVGDAFLDTPGYYYLHKKIPFYDLPLFQEMVPKGESSELNSYVSHVILRSEDLKLEGYEVIREDGEYVLWRSKRQGPVIQWQHYRPHRKERKNIAQKFWETLPAPPKVEFENR